MLVSYNVPNRYFTQWWRVTFCQPTWCNCCYNGPRCWYFNEPPISV